MRRSKADTGHAIEAARRLDYLLLKLVLLKLHRPMISNHMAKNLNGLAKRIRLAHELDLINSATRDDLRVINDVRVVFAHAEMPVRFTSAAVRIKVRRFDGWKPRASARRLFDAAVSRAGTEISAQTNRLI